MAELTADAITVRQGDRTLIDQASLSLKSGEFVILLGPNGAGKTSLIRAALGLLATDGGSTTLDGQPLGGISGAERARQIAYLPQVRPLAWPARVRDIVALGRYAHGAAPSRLSPADAVAVDRALAICDLAALSERKADTLSGGEAARMHCARAFATEAPLLMADEPIASLDPRNQFRVLDLIAAHVADGGGALVVLHDIRLAARYATRLVWMTNGKIVANGPAEETLTAARIADIYRVEALISGRQVDLVGPC